MGFEIILHISIFKNKYDQLIIWLIIELFLELGTYIWNKVIYLIIFFYKISKKKCLKIIFQL